MALSQQPWVILCYLTAALLWAVMGTQSGCTSVSSASHRQSHLTDHCEGACPSLGTAGPLVPTTSALPPGGHHYQTVSMWDLNWPSWCSSCEGGDAPVKIGSKCCYLRKMVLYAFLQQRDLVICCPLSSSRISVCCSGQIWCKIICFNELFSLPAPYPYFLCGS